MPHRLWPYPRHIGHRGAGLQAPENTIEALRVAVHNYDYRMVHVDVKISVDDVPFLFHDDILDRTTNATGDFWTYDPQLDGLLVCDQRWEALCQLDAGSWFYSFLEKEGLSTIKRKNPEDYKDLRIPTLREVSIWCIDNDIDIILEIKGEKGHEFYTGSLIARYAERLWIDSNKKPLVTSVSVDALAGAMDGAPLVRRGLILMEWYEGWYSAARRLECIALMTNEELWTEKTIDVPKKAGFGCIGFVVNKKDNMKRLFALGVDSIITDQVHMLNPDKKESKHFLKGNDVDGSFNMFSGTHCLRCNGPYYPPEEDDDSIVTVTKAMMAQDYLQNIKKNNVQVPYPTKALGNEPFVPYFSNADAELHIMESRRDRLMKNSSLTAVEGDKKLFPQHIQPDVIEFCSKCQHQGDVVEFGIL